MEDLEQVCEIAFVSSWIRIGEYMNVLTKTMGGRVSSSLVQEVR
jgi:hypothetical protein